MYRIRHRIIKTVLITEEGGEKTCVLLFDGYRCTCKSTHAKSQKHTCHLPAGINLGLSCTRYGTTQFKLNENLLMKLCMHFMNRQENIRYLLACVLEADDVSIV